MSDSIQNNVFHISYPTGYMDLRLDAFFPCTVVKARKISRLVRNHCSQEQKTDLIAYLVQRAKSLEEQAVELDRRLDACHTDRTEYERVLTDLKETVRKHSQLTRNVRDIAGRC